MVVPVSDSAKRRAVEHNSSTEFCGYWVVERKRWCYWRKSIGETTMSDSLDDFFDRCVRT